MFNPVLPKITSNLSTCVVPISIVDKSSALQLVHSYFHEPRSIDF